MGAKITSQRLEIHKYRVNKTLTGREKELKDIFRMTIRKTLTLAAAASALAFTAASGAQAAPVDLSGWTAEGPGTWNVQPGNDSVVQTQNAAPTVFYSDFDAFGNSLAGTIEVQTTGDDDYIGFVLGYNSGDLTAAATDFLVIDWKQSDQGFFGCTAFAGLSISRVSAGLVDGADAWCHQSSGGINELARATNLGSTGWNDNQLYNFDIEYTSTSAKVFVDGILELDIAGSFSNGRFGFYNYSQGSVEYAGITTDVIPGVPEPATWAFLIFGFGAVGAGMRAKRGKATVSYA